MKAVVVITSTSIVLGLSLGAYLIAGDSGERSSIPPAEEGGEEESEDFDSTERYTDACKKARFEPSFVPDNWSYELQTGEGGGGAPYPGLIGHYGVPGAAGTIRGAKPGFIDLITGVPGYLQGNSLPVEVLGEKASLGDIHEGYSVEFTHRSCAYVLMAFGIDRNALRDFAEGLVSRSDHAREFAMWPEDSQARAVEKCKGSFQKRSEAWRRNAQSTALAFANQVLGWPEAAITERDVDRYGQSLRISRYAGQDQGPGRYEVRVFAVEFDPLGAASAIVEVGYGGRNKSYTWPDGSEDIDFGSKPETSGHFLVLLLDESGIVFSARGGALPGGDFAAG